MKKRVDIPGGRGLVSKTIPNSMDRTERFCMAIEGVSKADSKLISKVVMKYHNQMEKIASEIDDSEEQRKMRNRVKVIVSNADISLAICHSKFYPLRLKEMLLSDHTFSLVHDIVGIERAIDKDKVDWSGDKYFVPRYSNPKKKGAWL